MAGKQLRVLRVDQVLTWQLHAVQTHFCLTYELGRRGGGGGLLPDVRGKGVCVGSATGSAKAIIGLFSFPLLGSSNQCTP